MALPGTQANTNMGTAASPPDFSALGQYLRAKAEPNLFDNYETNPWGTEAIQPGGTGAVIYAPTFTNMVSSVHTDKLGAGTELDPSTAEALAFSHYSATLGYYQGSFNISKVFAATATLQDYTDRTATFLMTTAAKTIENNNHAALLYSSGTTALDASGDSEVLYAAPDGETAHGSIVVADIVTPKGFAQARKKLRNANNPGFSKANGKFIGLVGPETVFQISSNVTTTLPSFEESSMGKESIYTDNVIGDLYGIRAIESTNVPALGTSYAAFDAAVNTGEMNLFLAPHAFYTASHESLGMNINVIPFNAPDKSDPSGQFMTIAIDYMHAAIQGDVANKLVHMPVALT